MVDIETILAGLYANELSASLEWRRPGGFHATLGNPGLVQERFRRSGEAVAWLKQQALVRFPTATFAQELDQVHLKAESIIDDLYGSHIGGSIEWIWDSRFFVSLTGRKQADRAGLETVGKAIDWLRDTARLLYPDSRFARKYRAFT